MILVIDIGNTNIMIGCMDGTHLCFSERITTDKKRTALEYTIIFKNVLELYHIDPKQVEGGMISSVVPTLTGCVQYAAQTLIQQKVQVVGPGVKNGLKIQTDNPAQLGSDQVVNAVAALAAYKPPLILVDMGTATTVSVLNKDGAYIGCLIMPGLKSSMESLAGHTEQLTQVSLELPKRLIGSNTADCMKSGLLYGHACAIDGLIDRIEKTLKHPCTIVAAGGFASLVVPLCHHSIIIEPNLALKGLQIIYHKNMLLGK